MKTLVKPPLFDAAQWQNETAAPQHYVGVRFPFDTVSQLIRPGRIYGTIIILGKTFDVADLQLEVPVQEPNYPIYFEISGNVYHYGFSIWADRVTIEVYTQVTPKRFELRSAMFPTTEAELRQALRTVVDDCTP